MTRRETEIAKLITEGLSNRQIAERLFLSERTVEGHLENIRRRLGFHSRAEIAAWVVEQRTVDPGPRPAVAARAFSPTIRTARSVVLIAVVGGLLVAVALAFAIQTPVPSSTISTYVGLGSRGFSGDFGPARAAQLAGPQAVAVDRAGNLYIVDSDNGRLREVIANQTIVTIAGGGSGVPSDGARATTFGLDWPGGLAVDSAGNLYLAYGGSNLAPMAEVLKVRPDGTVLVVAGGPKVGFSGDGGPATQALLADPTGLAIDTDGSLYIADSSNDRIRRVSPDGVITTVVKTGDLHTAADPAGADLLDAPQGLTVDLAGNLYFSVPGRNRIFKREGGSGSVSLFAGSSDRPGFGGDGQPAISGRLNFPIGVVAAPDGSVYVADYGNRRVRKVSVGGIINTEAGTGGAGSLGDGRSAATARLGGPFGLAYDLRGRLFVSDRVGNRVWIVVHP